MRVKLSGSGLGGATADKAASVLRGVSVLTEGPALGHDMEIGRDLVHDLASKLAGIPGRWTHGGLSADGLARHLGRWENPLVSQVDLCVSCGGAGCSCGAGTATRSVLRGDFKFSQSAFSIKPDGLTVSAPEYLMQRASEDPSSFGVSIVADLDVKDGIAGAANKLYRADFVADPAANPLGLHAGTGATSELTEGAVAQLGKMVEKLGAQEARARALGFIEEYFGGNMTELDTLKAELAAKVAEIEDLKKALTALVEAEQARKASARAEAVKALRSRAVELGSPIPEDDVAKVVKAYERGDEETATALSSAYISRSEAFSLRSAKPEKLGAEKPDSSAEFINDVMARLGLKGK